MQKPREYVRISKSLEVKYQIKDGILGSGSRSLDISKGGIRLPTIQKLKPGTILELEIRLQDFSQPIKAIGEVMWVSQRQLGRYPFEVGVKFIEVTPIDKELLNGFCKDFPQEQKPN
ncbi:MAG: PilZ domain-containing protein [Candidatus Omnitrophota bacterium]|jgi:c-di-GMP-binding flagellar brake protein YcgR